ncbi:MAG: ABC transporter [Bacteroidetes bacterium CG12_big_fil_rev_8_21_14_0_65_60_17]|nr:MAG: ABC transporter [Bacteroidetes bacterium CG12_big_fil_rev_8_21_14_0_65_60_17]
MIEVDHLVKLYGAERAVNDISFEVKQGEVLGFLGPNGAGKSTTMKTITCYLPPTEGTVRVDGRDVRTDGLEVRRRIGYLPEHTPLYTDMVVRDYLAFMARMRGVDPGDVRDRIRDMAARCGLESVLHKQIDTLSKGFRQRVGLAQAMIHNPPILILDEPTTGLDPNQIVEIRELIRSIGQEKTVILSTHILPEVQASCDRVLIIHRGNLVADGTPGELQAGYQGAQTVHIRVDADARAVWQVLAPLEGVEVAHQEQDAEGWTHCVVSTREKADLRPELFRLAVENGWTLAELYRDEADLEDVFRQLTSN